MVTALPACVQQCAVSYASACCCDPELLLEVRCCLAALHVDALHAHHTACIHPFVQSCIHLVMHAFSQSVSQLSNTHLALGSGMYNPA